MKETSEPEEGASFGDFWMEAQRIRFRNSMPRSGSTKAQHVSSFDRTSVTENVRIMYKPSKAIISIVVHALPAVLILGVSARILSDPANAKEGVIRYSFPKLLPRGFPDSIPEIPDVPAEATKVVDPIKTVAAKATKAAKNIPDAVSSAAAAVQSIVSSKLPNGCSVGTEYVCITSGDGADCSRLDAKGTGNLLGSEVAPPELRQLSKVLSHVPSLKAMVILTLTSVLLSFFCLLLKHYVPVWSIIVPLVGIVGLIFAVVVVSFTVSIAKAASQVEKVLGGELLRGSVYKDSIAVVGCTSLYCLAAVVGLVLGL